MVGSFKHGDDHGDVVAPATIERELHDSGRPARGSAGQRRRDRVVIDAVGQPIAAEQQAIAVLEAQQVDVDFDVLGGPPSALARM